MRISKEKKGKLFHAMTMLGFLGLYYMFFYCLTLLQSQVNLEITP